MLQSFTTRPFYFGDEERLFGILDLPAAGSFAGGHELRSGVVVCQPVGHESIWCHRACRRLAGSLAAAGHPVLRFDYEGCGDSLGESHEHDLDDWIQDVTTAVQYMRSRFAGLCVLGLRLGGTLALLAQQRGARIDRLVLWQPVVDGAAYLREMEALHAEHESQHGITERDAKGARHGEVLGFAFSAEARSALTYLDLAPGDPQTAPSPPDRLLLVNADGEDQRGLFARLDRTSGATPAEWLLVEEPSAWLAEPYKMVMPVKSIAAAADWISGEVP